MNENAVEEQLPADAFEFAEFDEKESEHIAAPRYSYWGSVWKTFVRNKFTVGLAIFINHLLGIAADIFLHSVVTICQPSVEHTLQLYSHYIRPLALWAFRRVCEVEMYGVGIALHLTIGHPFGIMSVERQFSKNLFAVDDKILEDNVMRLSCSAYLLITDTIEGAVLYIYGIVPPLYFAYRCLP